MEQSGARPPNALLRAWVEKWKKARPAAVVHCAAINEIAPFRMVSEAQLLGSMMVNAFLPVFVVQALLQLGQTPLAGPLPVVLVGSGATFAAGSHSLAYVASKHAELGVMRSMAKDLDPEVVTCLVNFGKLEDTAMSRHIDRAQAHLRGTTVEAERERQRAGWVGGREIPVREAARFVVDLVLRTPTRSLNGSVFNYGC